MEYAHDRQERIMAALRVVVLLLITIVLFGSATVLPLIGRV